MINTQYLIDNLIFVAPLLLASFWYQERTVEAPTKTSKLISFLQSYMICHFFGRSIWFSLYLIGILSIVTTSNALAYRTEMNVEARVAQRLREIEEQLAEIEREQAIFDRVENTTFEEFDEGIGLMEEDEEVHLLNFAINMELTFEESRIRGEFLDFFVDENNFDFLENEGLGSWYHDLTREGIEPNPGPDHGVAFCSYCGKEGDFCCGFECESRICLDENCPQCKQDSGDLGESTEYGSVCASDDTLYHDDLITDLLAQLSLLKPTMDIDDKIEQIIEYYKDQIENLEFETQMRDLETLSAKSLKERERVSNELKHLIKVHEKRLSQLRTQQRDAKKMKFTTQMFPSLKMEIGERTRDLLEELNDTLSDGLKIGLDDSTKEILTKLNESASGFKNILSGLSDAFDGKIFDLAILLVLIRLLMSSDITKTVKATLFSIASVYLGAKYGYKAYRTQMYESELKSIVNMVVFLVHSILILTIPGTKAKVFKGIDFFSNYNKINENFESGFSSVLLFVEKIVNAFRATVYQTENVSFLDSTDPAFDSWISRASAFVYKFQNGDKRVNIDKSIEVNELKRQGYELEQKHGNMRNKNLLYGKFLYLFTYVKKISDLYEDLDFADHSARVMPTSAIFVSIPGCGKTFPVVILGQTLLAHSLPLEELLSFEKNPWVYIYAQQAALGYADGMNGSEKVYIDSEFLQARQVPGVLTENHDFITDADTFPKQAHMAEAHKKGRTPVNPWFILKCTNNMNFNDNKDDITDPNAVWRRFGRHIYFVGVSDKYCTEESKNKEPWKREIDYNKCPIEWTSEVQEYYRIDKDQNVICKLTFDQIVADMLEDHKKSKHKHQVYIQTSRKRLNDIISSRMKTQMYEDDSVINDEEIEIKKLFTNYGIPLSMIRRFLKWLENRVRSDGDMELQVLLFREQFELELSVDEHNQKYFSNLFDQIYETGKNISSKIERFMNDYKGLFDAIKTVSLITTVCGSIGALTSYLMPKEAAKEQPLSFKTESPGGHGSGKGKKNKGQKTKRKMNQKVYKHTGINWQTEGGHDFGSHEMMINVFRRNMYEMYLPNRENKCGFVLFIRNRVFLMPMHFHKAIVRLVESKNIKVSDCVTLKKCSTEVSLQIPVSCFTKVLASEYEGEDFCLVEATKDFPLHKDIVSYFCSDDVYSQSFDRYGSLLCPSSNGLFEKTNSAFTVVDDVSHANVHDEFTNMLSILYNIDTKVGDCGAPFFLRNSSMKGGRLMGIHVSGTDNGHGMSVVVTKEELEEMLPMIDSCKVVSFDHQYVNQGNFPSYFAGVYPIGRHPSSVRNPTETKIVPSLLTGIFGPPKTKPARLAREFEGDELKFDPFMKGLLKNVRNRPNVDLGILKTCEDHLYSTLINNSKVESSVGKKTLTFEQAVLGIPEVDYCDSIPRNTSAGYPHAMPGGICQGKPGKTAFFGESDTYDLTNKNAIELRERVALRMANLKKGIRNEVIYMDFAKDERRPIAKVDEGKTRMINACPLEHLIEVRQLFMAFAMWIQSNRIDNGIAVGINPYSDEWHKLATLLKSKGPAVDAGDFSEFDYSELSSFLWSILHIINRWYNDEDGNNMARETAWYEVVNSVHINGSYVYHLVSSLPSGHPLTVIINSMYVLLSFRYVWILLHRGDISSIELFNEHIQMIAYGDDNVHNKSRYADSIMNESRLIELFSVIGLKYTNEKKDGVEKSMRTLADVSFLKRDFRYETLLSRYVAPLALDTILEFVYWTKRGAQKEEITKQNIDNCLLELSLHDKEIFTRYSSTLLLASLNKLNYCPEMTDRDYLLKKSRHIEEVW